MISLNFMFGVRDTSLALASRRDASSRGGRPRPREASPKEWHRPRNEKTFHFDRLFATPGAEISHRCEFSAPGVATPRRARRARRARAQRDDDAPEAPGRARKTARAAPSARHFKPRRRCGAATTTIRHRRRRRPRARRRRRRRSKRRKRHRRECVRRRRDNRYVTRPTTATKTIRMF